MVEENVGAGLRLEAELVDKQQQQPRAQGDQCPPVPARLNHINNNASNNINTNNNANVVSVNHASNNGSTSSASSTTSTGGGSTPSSSSCGGGGNNAPIGVQIASRSGAESNQHVVVKRLSTGSSPVDKRSSLSDKSVSPIDKRCSPVDRKDGSDVDRRSSSIGKTS